MTRRRGTTPEPPCSPHAHEARPLRAKLRTTRATTHPTRTGRAHEAASCVLDEQARTHAHRMLMPCTCARRLRPPQLARATRPTTRPPEASRTSTRAPYSCRAAAQPHEPRHAAAPGPPRTDRVHGRARVACQRTRSCREAPCPRTLTATEQTRHVVDPPPVIRTGLMPAWPGTTWSRQPSGRLQSAHAREPCLADRS